MIEINLLPEELRYRKTDFIKDLNIEMGNLKIIGASVLAGVLILLIVIPSLGSVIRKAQFRRLSIKEQALSQSASPIEDLNDKIALMKTIDFLTKREFLWAKKLDELSDLVLPGIWFTRIITSGDGRLMIEGSVISK